MASSHNFAGLLSSLAVAGMVAACSGGAGDQPGDPDAGAAVVQHESFAPLCDDVTTPATRKQLFTGSLIDVASVSTTVVLGELEPASPQEVMNYEQGFYVPVNAPLTSPGELYVEAITRSYHAFDDVTDYGIGYHLCSYLDGEIRKAAVYGNFAHVTSLNTQLTSLFASELDKFNNGQPSAVSCSGDANEECTLHTSRLRELNADPEYVLMVAVGTPLGTAGPAPGKTGPAGIDANLLDRRQNDFAGNYFINPSRLGAEAGHGIGWRYGACTYDYFVEPYRSQYLSKLSALGQSRVSADQPCGTLEIDRNAQGTVAGLWARPAIENQEMNSDWGGAELDGYLENILVLADHFTLPDTKMMLSTSIDVLSNLTVRPSAIVIDKAIENDGNWNNQVNVPFKRTQPGSIYCYAGTRYGGFESAYYLIDVSADGTSLRLQRTDDDCTLVVPALRAFEPASSSYFTFVR